MPLIETDLDRNALVQDLSNYFTFLESENTLELTMLPTGRINQTLFRDQVDSYGTTTDGQGVRSDSPATVFNNQLANIAYVTNYAMKMRETWGVDDMADVVDENPALGQGGFRVQSIKKAIIRLKKRMTTRLYSVAQAQVQSGSDAYDTCSIGGFITSSAPTGAQVVPAIARPASGQIYTGTWANLASNGATPIEDTMRSIVRTRYESAKGDKGNLKAVLGSQLKQLVSDSSIYRPNATGATIVRRVDQTESGTITSVVDHFVTDFGNVDMIPSVFIRLISDNNNTAVDADLAQRSGYLLDLNKWAIGYRRPVSNKDMPDFDSGPTGAVSAIFGLRSMFPGANCAILPAS